MERGGKSGSLLGVRLLVAILGLSFNAFLCSSIRAQSQTAAPGTDPAVGSTSGDSVATSGNSTAPPVGNEGGDGAAAPTSTEQGQTLIDDSFGAPSHAEWVRQTRRKALRDTDFSAEIRSFYMNSDNLNGSKNEAWALGGSAGFKTGYFRDFFALAATAYTSQRLDGPEDKDGTLLLAPGQHGYSVIGEAYGEFLLTDSIKADVGLRGYDTPFISRYDTRMTPNTFEAAIIQGSVGGADDTGTLRFGGGYVDKIKERDSETFVSMAAAAGAPAGVSRGVSLVGAIYKLNNLSIGAIEYYCDDIIDITYMEAKDSFALTDHLGLNLASQYTDQHSVGDNLLTGHTFSVKQFGTKAELSFGTLLLTAAYTATANGAVTVQSPWSGNPGYTTVQVENFDRGGENAMMFRAAYNFPMLKKLSIYALYVHGSQPDASKQYAQDESDFSVQWVGVGKLSGLTLLARYGHVSQDSPTARLANQLRLAVYYAPPSL
jgi:hypothetical protein